MKLYTVKPEAMTNQVMKAYFFQIIREENGMAFISPIKKNGTVSTLGIEARLTRWIDKEDLIEGALT